MRGFFQRRSAWLVTALVVSTAMGVQVQAQQEAGGGARDSAAVPSAEESPARRPRELVEWRRARSVVRIGQDQTVAAGEQVRDVVVIGGNVRIDGEVDGDLAVILGTAELGDTGVVKGSLVLIGGNARAGGKSTVGRDVVVVGGSLDAAPGFVSGGEHVVIGSPALGDHLRGSVPWLTRGLLWGRLLVPDVPWVWSVAGGFFLFYLVLILVFDRSVRAVGETLAARPLSTLLVGLLVLVAAGPLLFLLAVSVIGLAAVPFVVCALVVAALLGKAGVLRQIGASIVAEGDSGHRLPGLRSFLIGAAVVTVVYMLPVVGLISWAMLGIAGLGAAWLAFVSALRSEMPREELPAAGAMPTADSAPPSGAIPLIEPAAPVAPETPSIGTVPPVDLSLLPRASFLERALAFGLDVLLVFVVDQLFELTEHGGRFLLLLLAYHVTFWAWKGTTVGGIVNRLRVVRTDGSSLRFVDAVVRGLTAILSLGAFGLGCLWMLRDNERRTWHDHIAGTYVVLVPKGWPLP